VRNRNDNEKGRNDNRVAGMAKRRGQELHSGKVRMTKEWQEWQLGEKAKLPHNDVVAKSRLPRHAAPTMKFTVYVIPGGVSIQWWVYTLVQLKVSTEIYIIVDWCCRHLWVSRIYYDSKVMNPE
jgi:hypothetical protein